MIPLIVAAHYADAGLDIDKMLLCSSLPSANALKECLLDVATDSIVQLRNELHGNSWVYIMFDKGQDNNLCKRLAWWSVEEKKVKTVLVDVDKLGGSSNECALALKHSMKKLTGEETLTVKLAGQMTDSGGGGTLESVAKELKALGLQNDIYSIGSCTLHLLQLALATPMKKVFGDGGTNNLNVH